MGKSDFKEVSRLNFTANWPPSLEEVKTGALCRIADSLEKMEKPFLDQIKQIENLKKDRDYFLKELTAAQEKGHKLRASISALKGHITRLKKKQQQ
jgi:hypothetical protein